MIPTALIFIGAVGVVSFILILFLGDLWMIYIGLAGILISLFLILGGFIALFRFRRNDDYFNDANNVLNALTFFVQPIISIFCFPIFYILASRHEMLIALFLAIILQSTVRLSSAHAVKYCCRLFNCDKPFGAVFGVYVILTVFNFGSLVTGILIAKH